MSLKTATLAEVCTIEKGATGIMKAVPGEYPMVTLAEERARVIVPLISSTVHGHASMKRIHFQEGKFALGSILCAVIPKDKTVLDAEYLYQYLSLNKEKLFVPLMRGAANVSLSIKSISGVKIPLPSLAEQLEAVEHLKIVQQQFAALTTETAHQTRLLKALRQQLLQEAVRGELTRDWREKNPLEGGPTGGAGGAALLARIRAEKAGLIKAGKLKKEKPLPPIAPDEVPFAVPEGWVWCRLEEVCHPVVDCPISTPKYLDYDTGYFGIDTNCINDLGIITHLRNLSYESYLERIARLQPQENDVVFSREGSIGLTTVLPPDKKICLGQRVMLFRCSQPVLVKYFKNVLTSPIFLANLLSKHKGMGAKHVNVKDIRLAAFPLPPSPSKRSSWRR